MDEYQSCQNHFQICYVTCLENKQDKECSQFCFDTLKNCYLRLL